MRFRDQRAAAATPEPPKCPGCPRPLEFIDCPHGCGLQYLAAGQRISTDYFWRYGAWRMSVHLTNWPGRCVKPLMDGPPRLGPIPETTDETEEANHGMGT